MKPYFQSDLVTIYHGDCREILPTLTVDTIITDPVWPNALPGDLIGADRPFELFAETIQAVPNGTKRLAVQLGCGCDVRFLGPITADKFAFFRVCWLEYTAPSYKGRLLSTSDIAYLFGPPPRSRPGQHVIPGKTDGTNSMGKETKHPCPRKLSHVRWLVKWWTDPEDVVCDPTAGSGTTMLAAVMDGHKAVGIEIEEKYCEMAARRFDQKQLAFVS